MVEGIQRRGIIGVLQLKIGGWQPRFVQLHNHVPHCGGSGICSLEGRCGP